MLKDYYNCYVDVWKLFLMWAKRWQLTNDVDAVWDTAIKEMDEMHQKYRESPQRVLADGLLKTLANTMDDITTGNIKLD